MQFFSIIAIALILAVQRASAVKIDLSVYTSGSVKTFEYCWRNSWGKHSKPMDVKFFAAQDKDDLNKENAHELKAAILNADGKTERWSWAALKKLFTLHRHCSFVQVVLPEVTKTVTYRLYVTYQSKKNIEKGGKRRISRLFLSKHDRHTVKEVSDKFRIIPVSSSEISESDAANADNDRTESSIAAADGDAEQDDEEYKEDQEEDQEAADDQSQQRSLLQGQSRSDHAQTRSLAGTAAGVTAASAAAGVKAVGKDRNQGDVVADEDDDEVEQNDLDNEDEQEPTDDSQDRDDQYESDNEDEQEPTDDSQDRDDQYDSDNEDEYDGADAAQTKSYNDGNVEEQPEYTQYQNTVNDNAINYQDQRAKAQSPRVVSSHRQKMGKVADNSASSFWAGYGNRQRETPQQHNVDQSQYDNDYPELNQQQFREPGMRHVTSRRSRQHHGRLDQHQGLNQFDDLYRPHGDVI